MSEPSIFINAGHLFGTDGVNSIVGRENFEKHIVYSEDEKGEIIRETDDEARVEGASLPLSLVESWLSSPQISKVDRDKIFKTLVEELQTALSRLHSDLTVIKAYRERNQLEKILKVQERLSNNLQRSEKVLTFMNRLSIPADLRTTEKFEEFESVRTNLIHEIVVAKEQPRE